jgi:hypothetical protein
MSLPAILPSTREIATMTPERVRDIICVHTELDIDALAERLRPGAWSAAGFLADEQDIGEVIVNDARTLAGLGVDHRDISTRIELCQAAAFVRVPFAPYPEFRKHRGEDPAAARERQKQDEATAQGYAAQRHSERVRHEALLEVWLGPADRDDGTWSVPWSYDEEQWRGYQQDPLQAAPHIFVRGSTDFEIVRESTGERLVGGDLLIELIRRACFFEGPGTPYRIEPERAARVLGLVGDDPLAGRWRSTQLR